MTRAHRKSEGLKGPIKISNGPLKFGNLHVFEWDMGHLKGPSSFWAGINPELYAKKCIAIYCDMENLY